MGGLAGCSDDQLGYVGDAKAWLGESGCETVNRAIPTYY